MELHLIWALILVTSVGFTILRGCPAAAVQALLDGSARAVSLGITLAGPICLWSGLGALAEHLGLMEPVSRLLRPMVRRLFPSAIPDSALEHALCANFCANVLGLGSAATPMGIQAARRLRDPVRPDAATDELCRLVVLNTASVQLIPTTVAAVRAGAGALWLIAAKQNINQKQMFLNSCFL